MSNYIDIIKTAFSIFPLIAVFITIPFILIQYHKYGSISFLKIMLTYSFVLYLLSAYFLVILPLPSYEEVLQLTTKRVQLIPFSFIIDFVKNTSFDILKPSTYLLSLKDNVFFVPIYNILLTLPFGFYLRYFFKKSLKETIMYTFMLSLFFEITQFTGLFYIYPRGYRLFDVDDLTLNTLGGIIGFHITYFLRKPLPTIEHINELAKDRGKKVTSFRRTASIIFDFFLFLVTGFLLLFFINTKEIIIYHSIFYYVLIPILTKGSTLGQLFLKLRVVNNKGQFTLTSLIMRLFLFFLIYIFLPYGLFYIIFNLSGMDISRFIKILIVLFSLGTIFLLYTISFIIYVFTRKPLIYEIISKTKLVSTIK